MAERVRVRELTSAEGNKLLGIVRRGSGSVVRWRRAQIVLWSAQAMDVPAIAKIAFTSEDRVREVIHTFNADGFDSLAPKYAGGHEPAVSCDDSGPRCRAALALVGGRNRVVDWAVAFASAARCEVAEAT